MDLTQRAADLPVRRLVGIDVARCLALIGMMATHLLSGYDDGGVPWPQQLAGGRAAALFAVLAGVSLALMTGRQQPLQGRERAAASKRLAVRALVIAVIGLALGGLDSGVAVILTYYGLLFVLGLPFLGLRPPALTLVCLGWLVVVPVVSQVVRMWLPEASYRVPSLASLQHPGQLLSELTFTGYYPTVPWLAYLLAGMALGRLDLRRVRTEVLLVVVGVGSALTAWGVSRLLIDVSGARSALESTYAAAYPIEAVELDWVLVHGLYGTTSTESWWWLTVVAPHSGTPFDLAQTVGSAVALIGLCLLATRLRPRLFAVLFGAGAMTLTLYTAHVVMLTPQVWPPDEPSHYATHVLVVLGVGALFALARRRGPLETATALASAAGTRWLMAPRR